MSYCALASAEDAVMVVLLYFALTLIYKNVFWIRQLTIKRTLVLMLIGGIGAFLSEARHTSGKLNLYKFYAHNTLYKRWSFSYFTVYNFAGFGLLLSKYLFRFRACND